jgi:DNA-binding transcriptional MerR regulator
MRIGDLSRRLGVSPSKIRFLENKGLVRPVRSRQNGYRTYDEDTAVRLAMMLQAQTLGFTVREIRQAFMSNKSLECAPIISSLQHKRNEIENSIQQAQALVDRLSQAIKEMRRREKKWKATGVQIIAPLDSIGRTSAMPSAPHHRAHAR